jgi:hypothetical protein
VLLNKAMTKKKQEREHVDDRALGQAARETQWAYVFAERILDQTSRGGYCFSLVLGRVIAHELGHLVLPAPAHSESGIMEPVVELRSGAHPRFTPAEVRQISAAFQLTGAAAAR